MDALGQVLRTIRGDLDLSQEEMAKRLFACGARVSTKFGISRIEKRGTQKYTTLKAYAAVSGRTVPEIEALADTIRRNQN